MLAVILLPRLLRVSWLPFFVKSKERYVFCDVSTKKCWLIWLTLLLPIGCNNWFIITWWERKIHLIRETISRKNFLALPRESFNPQTMLKCFNHISLVQLPNLDLEWRASWDWVNGFRSILFSLICNRWVIYDLRSTTRLWSFILNEGWALIPDPRLCSLSINGNLQGKLQDCMEPFVYLSSRSRTLMRIKSRMRSSLYVGVYLSNLLHHLGFFEVPTQLAPSHVHVLCFWGSRPKLPSCWVCLSSQAQTPFFCLHDLGCGPTTTLIHAPYPLLISSQPLQGVGSIGSMSSEWNNVAKNRGRTKHPNQPYFGFRI